MGNHHNSKLIENLPYYHSQLRLSGSPFNSLTFSTFKTRHYIQTDNNEDRIYSTEEIPFRIQIIGGKNFSEKGGEYVLAELDGMEILRTEASKSSTPSFRASKDLNVKNLNSEIRVALFNKEPEFLIAEFFFSLRSFADNKEHKNLYSFRIDGLRGKDSPEIELSVHLQADINNLYSYETIEITFLKTIKEKEEDTDREGMKTWDIDRKFNYLKHNSIRITTIGESLDNSFEFYIESLKKSEHITLETIRNLKYKIQVCSEGELIKFIKQNGFTYFFKSFRSYLQSVSNSKYNSTEILKMSPYISCIGLAVSKSRLSFEVLRKIPDSFMCLAESLFHASISKRTTIFHILTVGSIHGYHSSEGSVEVLKFIFTKQELCDEIFLELEDGLDLDFKSAFLQYVNSVFINNSNLNIRVSLRSFLISKTYDFEFLGKLKQRFFHCESIRNAVNTFFDETEKDIETLQSLNNEKKGFQLIQIIHDKVRGTENEPILLSILDSLINFIEAEKWNNLKAVDNFCKQPDSILNRSLESVLPNISSKSSPSNSSIIPPSNSCSKSITSQSPQASATSKPPLSEPIVPNPPSSNFPPSETLPPKSVPSSSSPFPINSNFPPSETLPPKSVPSSSSPFPINSNIPPSETLDSPSESIPSSPSSIKSNAPLSEPIPSNPSSFSINSNITPSETIQSNGSILIKKEVKTEQEKRLFERMASSKDLQSLLNEIIVSGEKNTETPVSTPLNVPPPPPPPPQVTQPHEKKSVKLVAPKLDITQGPVPEYFTKLKDAELKSEEKKLLLEAFQHKEMSKQEIEVAEKKILSLHAKKQKNLLLMPKVIDAQKLNTVGVLLQRNKLTFKELEQFILNGGEGNTISMDVIEQLLALVKPNKRNIGRHEMEAQALLNYDGSRGPLIEQELFLKQLYSTPRIDKKLECILLQSQTEALYHKCKTNVALLKRALTELNSPQFSEFISRILTISNFLTGHSIKAFKFSSLPKLSSVKSPHNLLSKEKEYSLLDYLIETTDQELLQYIIENVNEAIEPSVPAMVSFQAIFPMSLLKLIELDTEISLCTLETEMKFKSKLQDFRNNLLNKLKELNLELVEIDKEIVKLGDNSNFGLGTEQLLNSIASTWIGFDASEHEISLRIRRDQERATFFNHVTTFLTQLKNEFQQANEKKKQLEEQKTRKEEASRRLEERRRRKKENLKKSPPKARVNYLTELLKIVNSPVALEHLREDRKPKEVPVLNTSVISEFYEQTEKFAKAKKNWNFASNSMKAKSKVKH